MLETTVFLLCIPFLTIAYILLVTGSFLHHVPTVYKAQTLGTQYHSVFYRHTSSDKSVTTATQ